MINYFLVYRPFHLEYILSIIEMLPVSQKHIVINQSTAISKSELNNTQVEIINIPGSSFERIKSLRQIKSKILVDCEAGNEVTVYIPHTLGILANYAYNYLTSKYKNLKVNVFYEGVIVFYDYQHGYFKHFKHYFTRKLAAFACGIHFKIEKRLLDFYDERINLIYSPFINIPAPKEKIIHLPLKKIEFVPSEDTCIILGLKLSKKYDNELNRIIRQMFKRIDDSNVKTIYFKDHPYEPNEKFFEVAEELTKKLIVINSTSPIEKIISDFKPKYVFSIWSSGMINLSQMLPNSVKLSCFVTHKIIDNDELKKLMQVFESQNIEVNFI